jgi:hypothetical protein
LSKKNWLQSHRARLRSESGQSIILVASVLISFMLFFGFVINTGLLVTAKISLQSAADAAAYAGAATQARQLNAISFLNYDMRRQFKKFAHRYSFVASLGNPEFFTFSRPELIDSQGRYQFNKQEYAGSSTTARLTPIGVPSVCIPLTTGQPNDNCLFVNLPNTARSFQGPGLSNISKLLFDQLNAIQEIQKNLCAGNSNINLFVLMNWLFKAKPGNEDLITLFNSISSQSTLKPEERDKALQTVSALVDGLGLFPRNILNLLRIETLVQFLNQAPQVANLDSVESWEQAAGADQYERTILAFRSALSNLNEKVLDPQQLEMTELQSQNQIRIEPVTAGFNAYVHYMIPGQGSTSKDQAICQASILPFQVFGAPVGVKKSSPSTVHYAVKLKARVKLMFLPLSDGLELEAVAAAKPFGARIGPANLSPDDFVSEIQPGRINGAPINDCQGSLACRIPNPRIDSSGTSFYSASFIQAVRSFVPKDSANAASLTQAMRAATAPQPIEVGRYNILPPPKPTQGQNTSDMKYEFIPYSDSNNSQVYRFYAPLFLANQSNTAQRISQVIDQTFGNAQVSGQNPFKINMDDMKSEIKRRIAEYVNGPLASANQSELDESLTFAALDLPMANVPRPPQGSSYWLTEARSVQTAWAPTYARITGGQLGFQPRFAYSVKFVTMQNLLQAGMPDADDELGKVSH